jgi:hypothetical protein
VTTAAQICTHCGRAGSRHDVVRKRPGGPACLRCVPAIPRSATCEVCGEAGTRARPVHPGRGVIAHRDCRPKPQCKVAGCDKPGRMRRLCSTHYHRVYGRGKYLSLNDPRARGFRPMLPLDSVRPSGLYLQEKTLDGWMAQHQLCFLRRFGLPITDVPCEWCGKRMARHVHHVDHDRRNNDPDNLVGICVPCHNAYHHPMEVA